MARKCALGKLGMQVNAPMHVDWLQGRGVRRSAGKRRSRKRGRMADGLINKRGRARARQDGEGRRTTGVGWPRQRGRSVCWLTEGEGERERGREETSRDECGKAGRSVEPAVDGGCGVAMRPEEESLGGGAPSFPSPMSTQNILLRCFLGPSLGCFSAGNSGVTCGGGKRQPRVPPLQRQSGAGQG